LAAADGWNPSWLWQLQQQQLLLLMTGILNLAGTYSISRTKHAR